MRTTITLDPDVEALVTRAMRERKMSFKAAVNDALRRGLAGETGGDDYEVPTHPLGARVDLTKATQLAGELEDAEIIRKMRLGK
ncbi:ribbon-helix-helix domain-containing protein [Solicola gregarius]|uniref:Ribbon-helix-helix domain-containing protein n=1 Tax=Solicola gregarius TaxID=2908642 RepID=A0AA46YJ31_9ACTN|nr:CopG family transcriptional regulator [Solicola gregarius]UYM04005.1 ribbon-helix-helix domain-containing protein [Solicola gregarius]